MPDTTKATELALIRHATGHTPTRHPTCVGWTCCGLHFGTPDALDRHCLTYTPRPPS